MKLTINNESIDFKILKSSNDSLAISINDQIYSFGADELKKDIQVSSSLVHAFGSTFEIKEPREGREKNLKIYSPSSSQTTPVPQNHSEHLVAAIMKAYTARA